MSAFLLKLIALITMMIDHIGVVYQPLFDVSLYRFIGRIAFPIFVFFIAEGCRRTSNIEKYVLRLGLFALISELPFTLAMAPLVRTPNGIFDLGAYNLFSNQNVFFTFFLGTVCVYLYQEFRDGLKQLICIILIPFIVYLGNRLNTDFGSAGVLFVFILYIIPYSDQKEGESIQLSAVGKTLRIAALFCMLYFLYVIDIGLFNPMRGIIQSYGVLHLVEMLPDIQFMLYSCIALVILAFYNNKRGRPQRWIFYAFYPFHLLVLGFIRYFYVIPRI